MSGIHSPEQAGTAWDGSDTGPARGLDATSAMVRAEADHLEATLQALVARLGSVPGLSLSVSYRHGRLRRFLGDLPYINDLTRKTGPLQRLVIGVGEHTYVLHRHLGAIRCSRQRRPAQPGHHVEELSFGTWAKALFEGHRDQGLQRLFIEMPDQAKDQVVWKWPD
ncbi:MAG: hypothetical protein JO244_15475, partial [Solirubrobacterales bacterium]|nr:hypothetical protein [Solirubrobacterales bacterium]